jgi:hypothetical protein
MRTGSIVVVAGIAMMQTGVVWADDAKTSTEQFQICRSDSPQKCGGEIFIPCNGDAGVMAQISCLKKGWKFFTVAKSKEIAGGACGATIYSARCEWSVASCPGIASETPVNAFEFDVLLRQRARTRFELAIGIREKMETSFLFVAALVLTVTGCPIVGTALEAGLTSSEKLEIKLDPKKLDENTKILWDRFGGFCQIAEWHPVVFSCTEDKDNGAIYRVLSLKDGGKIKEKLLSRGPSSYRYAIVESPLPVKNYEAEFSMAPMNGAIDIVWSATYEPADGRSDGDARASIDGVFRDGIASIRAKLPDVPGLETEQTHQKH